LLIGLNFNKIERSLAPSDNKESSVPYGYFKTKECFEDHKLYSLMGYLNYHLKRIESYFGNFKKGKDMNLLNNKTYVEHRTKFFQKLGLAIRDIPEVFKVLENLFNFPDPIITHHSNEVVIAEQDEVTIFSKDS